ncbi:hypothetical protein ATCC90586_001547 [Pythium insidiosum]|nr:hypothetical protein ATCC90586_001547 [Pythium insidiosum]
MEIRRNDDGSDVAALLAETSDGEASSLGEMHALWMPPSPVGSTESRSLAAVRDSDLGEVDDLLLSTLLQDISGSPLSPREPRESIHAVRSRRNRESKKHEVSDLRATVRALEATLARYRNPVAPSSSRWEAEARRRLAERQRVVLENRRLRELTQRHSEAVQRIVRSVKDAAAETRRLEGDRPARGAENANRRSGGSHSHERMGSRRVLMELVEDDAGHESAQLCVQETKRLGYSLKSLRDATWNLDLASNASQACTATQCNEEVRECPPSCGRQVEGGTGVLTIRRVVEPERLLLLWDCKGCLHCEAPMAEPVQRITEHGSGAVIGKSV